MKKDNNNTMNVYVVEANLIDGTPVVSMGMRTISKEDFLQQAYKIIDCDLVDVRELECNGKY